MLRTIASGLCIGLLASFPSAATAGTYEVRACQAAANGVNNAWVAQPANGLDVADTCAGGGDEDFYSTYTGLFVRDSTTNGGAGGNLPAGSQAWWRFDAPAGTRIVGLRYTRNLAVIQSTAWRATVETDDGEIEGCRPSPAETGCVAGGGKGGLDSGSIFTTPPLDTQWLRFGTRCVEATCPAGGGTIHDTRAVVSSVIVTLEDSVAPAVAAPSGPLVASGPFASGLVTVTASADDAQGISDLEVLVDGQVVAEQPYSCDYTFPRPCAQAGTSASTTTTVDVSPLAEGLHTVSVRATDAAGNVATGESRSFEVVRPPSGGGGGGTTPQPPGGGGTGGGGTGGGGTTPQPPGGGGTPPVTPLAAVSALRLQNVGGRSAVSARGRVVPGCARRVTLKLSGTERGRTRSRSGSTKPRASGSWALRVKRPSGLARSARLVARLTVVARPSCRAPKVVRRTLR